MVDHKRSPAAHASVTIKDVAMRAGVSRTAVSFVLNERGEPNKHVSDEARAKILQAIEELRFQPDQLARTLRKKQSWELASIIDVTLTVFGIETMTSVQQQAQLYGYTPVMYFSQGLTPEQRRELYQTIFARRPLAILVSPLTFSAENVAQARQMGIEHILFYGTRAEPVEHTHAIAFPGAEIGYLAAQHLLERGHRRLAIVRPDDPVHRPISNVFLQRLSGMRAAIAEHPAAAEITLEILPLRFSAPEAAELVATHLTRAPHPTGIYAFNDEYALYLLGALAQAGLRVPRQISVLGTDNISVGACSWPSLSTIDIDKIDIGKRAIEILHTLHQGLPLPPELTTPLVPCLIQRQST